MNKAYKISGSKNLATAIEGQATPRYPVIPLGHSRNLDGCDIIVLQHIFARKLTAFLEHPLISSDGALCKLWETIDQDGDTYYIAACAEVDE